MVIKITDGFFVSLMKDNHQRKKSRFFFFSGAAPSFDSSLEIKELSAEAVEGASLSLERVDDVEGGDGLSLGVLSVGDGITDDVLEEDLEDTSGLFVDQTGDSLDTASSSESTDGWLGDTLDVITKDLSVTLGAALSESFTSFSTSRHD